MKYLYIVLLLVFITSCADTKVHENQDSESGQSDSSLSPEIDSVALLEKQIADSMSQAELIIYPLTIRDLGKGESRGFIPLTYIFPWDYERASSVIAPKYLGMEKYVNDNYHVLQGKFRDSFLMKARIREGEHVFIYNVEKGSILSIPVKELKIVAFVNPYGSNGKVREADYQIGFEFQDASLASEGYLGSFVAIGEVNPFEVGEIKPIIWTEMKNVKFPNFTYSRQDSARARGYIPTGETFTYHHTLYDVYVRDLKHQNSQFISARQVLVLSSDSGNILLNKIFYSSEGSYLEELNIPEKQNPRFLCQWTGKLFKYKAPVIYGFLGMSFDCPSLYLLDGTQSNLKIYCDNRH